MSAKVVDLARAERVVKLFRSFDTFNALLARTDLEIAQQLIGVWAELPLTHPHASLLEQAIERLKRADGGELVVPPEAG